MLGSAVVKVLGCQVKRLQEMSWLHNRREQKQEIDRVFAESRRAQTPQCMEGGTARS